MISVVIPAYNEAESLATLYEQIKTALHKLEHKFEVIFVNDGSNDNTQKEAEKLHKQDPNIVRVIRFRHNFGKAAALHAGFAMAKGETILTLDADLQDDPSEIHKLLEKLEEGFDLVSGWKQHRRDSFVKNNTSKIFNWFTNRISKAKLHDFNCGFKAYRSDAIKGLSLYGELHRYIPVLVAAKGYRVTEVGVRHREREHGKTKYGNVRFVHGALDLLTVLFITRYRSRPLHLFGYLGITTFGLGVVTGLYLVWQKMVYGQHIGERPLLLLAVLLVVMGTQIGVTGIVGEQIAAMIHEDRPGYEISAVLMEME